jgi:hypothetical protein
MTSHHSQKSSPFSAADFPALRSFLRGYFHQDMKEEYGSAEAAAQEFYADADAEERAAVADEWLRFVEHTRGQSVDAMNRLLTGPLGSAYSLTAEDMQRITVVLSKPRRKPRD